MQKRTTKILVFTFSLTVLVAGFVLTAAAPKKPIATCSVYDAVYKPHPDYQRRDLDFDLRVRRPLPGEGSSMRMVFYYFDAFDRAGDKVSTLRMAEGCGLGVPKCTISATRGQFRNNSDYVEFRTNLTFDPLSLSDAFMKIESFESEPPYAFIFLETKQKFYWMSKAPGAKLDVFDDFVRYYTPQKVLPDFGGYDVWLFDRCVSRSARE
jgi:hypothetical protein